VVKFHLKKWILPLAVFVFWSAGIIRWTEGFGAFTTYSAALSRAGKLPRQAPDFKFQTMDQVKGSMENYKGRYILVEFMYLHCPTVCGILRARLFEFYPLLKNELNKNLSMLSISFDPERDTPEILKQSWQSLGEKKHWEFAALEGSHEEIKKNLEKFGFIVYQDTETLDFNHTALFFLINPEGKLVATLDPSVNILENIKKIRNYIKGTSKNPDFGSREGPSAPVSTQNTGF
jgi:protein SCO1/2